jgi:hypothetical protein
VPAELSGRLLEGVLRQVLEEAAFVFAEPAAEGPADEGELLEARLRYVARHAGELRLVTSADAAAALAASVLGEEPGGTRPAGQERDLVGELLNMVAGSLAVALFGDGARCALGVPQVTTVTAGAHRRERAAADAVVALVDEAGHRLELTARVLAGAAR